MMIPADAALAGRLLRRRLIGAVALGAAMVTLAGSVSPNGSTPATSPLIRAQGRPSPTAVGQQGIAPLTFDMIADAERSLWLDVEQKRRVLDHSGSAPRWLEITEHLRSAPAPGGGTPRFRLELLGIGNGAGLSPQELQTRRELYQRHTGYLHLHGSLRIENPYLAAQNYFLVFLSRSQRLNRPVRKYAIIPRQFGANPWVVDIDVATSYPLYRGEFDAAGTLVSELEVTRFEDLRETGNFPASWWSETLRTTHYPTLDAALAQFPNSTLHFPRQRDLPPGYQFDGVKVVLDDLRPEPSVVATYSDGIDELFTVATLNAPQPSAPQVAAGPHDTYALLAYRDLNIGQYMFYDPTEQVRYLVVGKGGQLFLGSIARELLVRAVGGA